ncbi:MAG: hypothetical protein M3281_00095 [Chloroflexota bacterium]|nr:hypothetical protein [Chloroflexota bacterium]
MRLAPRRSAVSSPNIARHRFVGNTAAKELLRASVLSGKGGHAHLLIGPPRLGKRTLALWLAQLLCCPERSPADPEPCGVCNVCGRIARGTYPDVRVFSLDTQAESAERATASRELGIDNVRQLVSDIDLLPFQGDRKVYVLDDAEVLTEEAANALLKTLEEPPAFATLVLLATEDSGLPQTIRSRCNPVRLRAVGTEEIYGWLRELEPDADPTRVRRIAELAVGRPGWALEALRDPGLVEEHDEHVRELLDATRDGAGPRLALAEKLGRHWSSSRKGARQEVYAELFDWLGFWRETMARASGLPATASPYQPDLDRLASRGTETLGRAAQQTLDAIARLDANVNTRMAIENLLLDLP